MAINKHFDINISQEVLKFHLNKGCLSIKADITDFLRQAVENMNGWQSMVVLICIAAAVTGGYSYSRSIDKDIAQIQSNQETTRLKAVIDALSQVKDNRDIERATNASKRAITSILENDEVAYINPEIYKDQTPLTHADTFRSSRASNDESEHFEIVDGLIANQDFLKDGKPFKLQDFKLLLNSDIISADERIKLIRKAENKEPVKLKIKNSKKGRQGYKGLYY